MAKKISIKVGLLLVIITALNFAYKYTLFKKDLLEKCPEAITIHETQKNTDIYYFGESSNITSAPGDSVKNSISELTNLFFPSLKITAINKYATHAGIYKYWLNEIDLRQNKPRALVVTLNLRSFDAAWIHSKLETQLQESIVFTRPFPDLMNRFFLSLQVFDNKTEEAREKEMLTEWKTKRLKFPYPFKYTTVSQWDEAMGMGTYLKPDGSWDMDKIVLACHYIKSYAFNIDETNPRIRDFDEIARWCDEKKINLYLNLMAENVQYADSLVGKELVFLMKQNRDYLVTRYNRNNCRVIDNLELVDGADYIDQKWTTEHYNYKGRMSIAANLARTLKNQFNKQYKDNSPTNYVR
jgi:hypothetical protein